MIGDIIIRNFSKNAVELLPQQNFDESEKEFKQLLAQHRKRFREIVISKLNQQSDLHSVAQRLEGAKALIRAYIDLGAPEAFSKYDFLSGMLKGNSGLYDLELLKRALNSDASVEEFPKIKDDIMRRISILEEDDPNAPKIDFGQPLVNSMMSRLRVARQQHLEQLPKTPIAEALTNLLSDLNKL